MLTRTSTTKKETCPGVYELAIVMMALAAAWAGWTVQMESWHRFESDMRQRLPKPVFVVHDPPAMSHSLVFF